MRRVLDAKAAFKWFATGLFVVFIGTSHQVLACSFNCSKTPELKASGFISKNDQTAPYANSYRGEMPEIVIENAQSKRLIIWLHGQGNPRKKERCSAQHNLPPRSVIALDEMPDTHVYYHCTAVVDPRVEKDNVADDGIHYTRGYAMGAYTLGRRDELEGLLDHLIALGVQPENITVTGHSAGAWTGLLAAASYPEKFETLIAFAPAFAGPRNEETMYPWWRKIVRPEQIEMLTKPNDVKKLIFAYTDDAFNRPAELAFLEKAFPQTSQVISQSCGAGHNTHKKDCKKDETIALMKALIVSRQ